MYKLLNFLNNNQGAIQAILVFVLVGVTIWYAISSNKMTNIMKQEYELSTSPYLFLSRTVDRNRDFNNTKVLQLVFHFTNGGKVPVEYFIEELILSNSSINPEKVTSLLFPNQEGTLSSNLYISDSIDYPCDGLTGNIKFIFWAHGLPDRKYYLRRDFALATQMYTFIIKEEFGQLENQ